MLAGTVTDDGVPVIMLLVAGQMWPSIIDTGFNGDLELPESLRQSLNARFIGRTSSLLGGGQSVEEDVYLVDFPFDDRTVHAEATFVLERHSIGNNCYDSTVWKSIFLPGPLY